MKVNLNICPRCPRCVEFVASENDISDRLEVGPMVTCELGIALLTAGSDVPDDCPYTLEHLLTQRDAWNDAMVVEEELNEAGLQCV